MTTTAEKDVGKLGLSYGSKEHGVTTSEEVCQFQKINIDLPCVPVEHLQV